MAAISFLGSLFVDMTSTINDVYKSSTVPNDFSLDKIEGIDPVDEKSFKNNTILSNGHIKLNSMNFMPFYAINEFPVPGMLDRKEHDIYDENNNLDYDKLSKYI